MDERIFQIKRKGYINLLIAFNVVNAAAEDLAVIYNVEMVREDTNQGGEGVSTYLFTDNICAKCICAASARLTCFL